MLQIRKQQFEALAQYARKQYVDRMAVLMRRLYPQECGQLGDEATRLRISSAVDQAKEFDIVENADVQRFIQMTFQWGPQFATLPWASRILAMKQMTAAKRMNSLAMASGAQLEAQFEEMAAQED